MPLRTLIVEDESLLVMLLEDVLPELGYDVTASVDNVDAALAALDRHPIDLAVLDINLAGTPSFPVADALDTRGIPYLFATSYGAVGVPEPYRHAMVLQKPYGKRELENALARLVAA